MKGFICDKKVSSENSEERQCREKEEATKNFFELQIKKLSIDEYNFLSRAKKVELTILTEETQIMMADLSITAQGWFEKKKILILDRDA